MATKRTQARTGSSRSEPARIRAGREIDVAIELVARGAAATVRLAGISGAERLAARAAAHASAVRVGLRVERHDASGAMVVVGPILPDDQSSR